jgi:Xaa-Pro dipeptidase
MSDAPPAPPPAEELARRRRAVQAGMARQGLDGLLLVAAADVVYLAGTAQSGHLVVPAEGEPWLGVRRDLDRAVAESALERVEPLRSLRGLPDALAGAGLGGRVRLGLELDVLPAASYLRYRDLLPEADLADAMPAVWAARSRKTPWELERIRRACAQVDAAFARAPEILRPGRRECDALSDLGHVLREDDHEGALRFRGLDGDLFFGQVLGGPSAAVPGPADTPLSGGGLSSAHGRGPGRRTLRAGDAVVVDLSGLVEGYCSDETRTFFVGEPDPHLRAALEVCRRALAACVERLVPGTPSTALYDTGLEVAEEAGLGEHYMGHGPARVRFVGHGIGLEVNEPPYLARGREEPLAEGNVVAVEPKLVFPGEGAVGIENSYLVTADGPVRLTAAAEQAIVLPA